MKMACCLSRRTDVPDRPRRHPAGHRLHAAGRTAGGSQQKPCRSHRVLLVRLRPLLQLEPASEAWAKNKPADVDFRREQIVWDKRMDGLARLFAAIRASGQSGKLHHAAFIAVQQERLDLRDPKIVQDWVARTGVDAARFMQVYNSFSVACAPARATQLTRAYRVEGTPMLVVGRQVCRHSGSTRAHDAGGRRAGRQSARRTEEISTTNVDQPGWDHPGFV